MKQRNIRIRAIRRDPPDVKLLAKAFVELAIELQKQEGLAAKAGSKKSASDDKTSSPSPN